MSNQPNRKWVALAAMTLTACGGSGLGAYDSTGDTGQGLGGLTTTIPVNGPDMIDDLEDGDSSIMSQGGRVGSWYSYNDGSASGVQTPPANGNFMPMSGGANGTGFAVHTTGSGFSEWGAGVSFGLKDDGGTKEVFDASSYTGIVFWAKGDVSIYVSVPTDAVTDQAWGGTCVAGSGDGQGCDDAHGLYFALTDDWQQFAIPFDQVQQGGWGQAHPFDPARLLGVQFEIAQDLTFDVWVDEIGLYY